MCLSVQLGLRRSWLQVSSMSRVCVLETDAAAAAAAAGVFVCLPGSAGSHGQRVLLCTIKPQLHLREKTRKVLGRGEALTHSSFLNLPLARAAEHP